MRFSPAPPTVQKALMKQGRYWDEEEVLAAFEWMFCDNFARLVRVAACRLGCGLAIDAEDECQNFAVGRFRRVIHFYDPSRGAFEGLLVVCLRRYCGARARVLARRAARNAPLQEVNLENPCTAVTPESRFLGNEARTIAGGLIPLLQRVLSGMSVRDRSLLQMQFRGASMKDRAAALSLSLGAAKTAACRARQRLAKKLGPETATRLALGIGGAR